MDYIVDSFLELGKTLGMALKLLIIAGVFATISFFFIVVGIFIIVAGFGTKSAWLSFVLLIIGAFLALFGYFTAKYGNDKYHKYLNKYLKQSRGIAKDYQVPPLPEDAKGLLINEVGDRCENPICKSPDFPEVHHIRRRIDGGRNNLGNLIVLCELCHKNAHSGAIRVSQLNHWVNRPNRFRRGDYVQRYWEKKVL